MNLWTKIDTNYKKIQISRVKNLISFNSIINALFPYILKNILFVVLSKKTLLKYANRVFFE